METPEAENFRLFGEITRTSPADEEIGSGSQPDYFWIGCSDYPMSPCDATGVPASDFVFHDNISNLVASADINCLAGMQFAVDVLRVKTIVVCGHYECRGITLAIENRSLDILGNWLAPIRKTHRKYKNLLDGIGDESKQMNALCELNVIEQVINACRTTIVEDAWKRGQDISVGGFVYNQQNGLLIDLNIFVENQAELSIVYATAISNFERRWQI